MKSRDTVIDVSTFVIGYDCDYNYNYDYDLDES
jgi:hypothetical protein